MGLATSLHNLEALAWRCADRAIPFAAYLDGLACVVQERLDCSAVALWSLEGPGGSRTLSCLACYRSFGVRVRGGAVLAGCFAALDPAGSCVCSSTQVPGGFPAHDRSRRSEAPREFLDQLVSINGKPCGIVSCHHEDGSRRWRVEDVTSLRRIGARAALHVARLLPEWWNCDCDELVRGRVPRCSGR